MVYLYNHAAIQPNVQRDCTKNNTKKPTILIFCRQISVDIATSSLL